jgi:membrane protease YdiL (CAAX protease family)
MDNRIGSLSALHEETRNRVVWLLITGLFLLRIPFVGGMRYFTWTSTSYWVMPIFEIGTYLLAAILIWLERDRLLDNHVDRLALFIFVLGKPVELLWSRFPGPFGRRLGSEAYLLYLPVAIGLLIGLSRARPKLIKFGPRRWLWLGIGVLTGIIVGALSGRLSKLEFNPLQSQLTLGVLVFLPIREMLYAGIAEEPFFRGFLWGALRRRGWKDIWVLMLQGMLFWLAHIYWLEHSPITFWVIVPLGGLVFGVLAWCSRSIAVSMIAHGLMNGVLNMVVFYQIAV